MRIVLSISGSSGHAGAARWTLEELLSPLGYAVADRPEAGETFLLLSYGEGRPERAEDLPRVLIPRLARDLPEGCPPEPPLEVSGGGEGAAFAFPPLHDLPPGKPLGGAVGGRPVACVVSGVSGEVRFAFDLVSAAHFLLSRREERGAPRDPLDRFVPETSWAARHGLLEEPLVDRLGDMLRAAIEAALASSGRATVRILPWPAGKSFAVALTHDEDLVIRWERRLARHAAQALAGRGGSRRAGLRSLLRDARAGRVSPLLLSERLASWESARGIRSTFFFLAVREDRFGRRYDVGSSPFRRFIRSLLDRGHAAGLHGGIEGYLSRETFVEERSIVSEASGRPVAGVRQHYLRLRVPETWIAQSEAGLRYDASLGFADAPGFRGGTSFPFRPEVLRDFLVFPLNGMDRALVAAGLAGPDAWDRWSLPARQAGGLVDVLWHPYFIDPDLGPEREPLARTLLDWVAGKRSEAWVATLDEIASWWTARRLVSARAADREGRSLVRVRFGIPLASASLAAAPRGADMRIEASNGARAEIADRAAGRVLVTEIAEGAEVLLSLAPNRAGGGA